MQPVQSVAEAAALPPVALLPPPMAFAAGRSLPPGPTFSHQTRPRERQRQEPHQPFDAQPFDAQPFDAQPFDARWRRQMRLFKVGPADFRAAKSVSMLHRWR